MTNAGGVGSSDSCSPNEYTKVGYHQKFNFDYFLGETSWKFFGVSFKQTVLIKVYPNQSLKDYRVLVSGIRPIQLTGLAVKCVAH